MEHRTRRAERKRRGEKTRDVGERQRATRRHLVHRGSVVDAGGAARDRSYGMPRRSSRYYTKYGSNEYVMRQQEDLRNMGSGLWRRSVGFCARAGER